MTKPWESRIVGLEHLPPASLNAHPSNFRIHPIGQKEALSGSLGSIGWVQTVVMNRVTGRIIDGHLRVALALARGETTVPVTVVELTEAEEAQALLSLDPIAAMAETDREKMSTLMQMVDAQDEAVLQYLEALSRQNSILPAIKTSEVDAEPQLDRADELQEKWNVHPGEMWALGSNHRLICADCMDHQAVSRLMDGEKASICWTDPPWNVNYGASSHPSWKPRSIQNDNLGANFPAFVENFCKIMFINLQPGALVYLVMSAQEWPVIHRGLTDAGFHWSSTIIWAKDRPVLSRKDYHTQYEPIWYGWRGDAARLVELTDRRQSDLWEIPRPARSDEHPTMKPVELVERSLLNSSRRGDLVFEPFAGSGTVAIAAERVGRRSRNIELEPKFCAVILERYMQATGDLPILMN